MKKQKWLLLKYNGWHIVVPNFDIEPHGNIKKGKRNGDLAGMNCPCKPRVDWENQIIIHESFIHMKKVDGSMKKLFT